MASPYLDALRPDEHRALVDTLLTRQSGRCFVCAEPIDPSAHPDALQIDLVQPLESGGADEPANCAALHTGCSRSRQHADLGIARALALFGRIREVPADVWRPPAPERPPVRVLRAGPTSPEPTPTGASAAAGSEGFWRTLVLTVLGAVLPGAGYLAVGRRKLGLAVLAATIVGLVVAALLLVRGGVRDTAVELASRPQLLLLAGVAALVIAVGWIVVVVTGHWMVRPATFTPWQRRTGGALVVVLSLGVLVPALLVARYAFATKDLLDTVFESAALTGDTPLTQSPIDREDPWKDTPRLNVLLLGGDSARATSTAGMGGGFLTTTVIVASIDTATGDTVLVSLPHDLQNAPIPVDNPLASLYPTGYTCSPDPKACLLNGVYREAQEHPELFPSSADPGVTTVSDVVSEITGISLDYHVFVDFTGFASLVDAVGGIDLDVGPVPVPVTDPVGGEVVETIPAGRQHLNGAEAVAFARDRPDATAASAAEGRVRRQTAVIGALLAAADPADVVTKYLVLSNAAQQTLSTDVPIELLPALVDLTDQMRTQPLDVLPLPADAVIPTAPDYPRIRAAVTAELGPPTG